MLLCSLVSKTINRTRSDCSRPRHTKRRPKSNPPTVSRTRLDKTDSAVTMCYGHPHHHPCGHQSVKWHYCPRAKIDVTTGHATVCNKTTYAISQPAKTRCPLKNCHFKEVGGVWDCCTCKQGPNTQGWCTFSNPSWKKNFQKDEYEWVETCDHGCCKNCTRSGKFHLIFSKCPFPPLPGCARPLPSILDVWSWF